MNYNLKELRKKAKTFRDKEANPPGMPHGTNALRADVAYMWVSRFIDFVENQEGGKE